MARQPYLTVVKDPKGGMIDVGTRSIGQRPDIESRIGNCLMAWPHIEAEMAVVFAQLIGGDNVAALAVFQTIRRSVSQRDAISEAAKVSLNEIDTELLSAILSLHKSIEAERNALAHGHFGTSTKLPDAVVWMNTADYIATRTSITLTNNPQWDDERHLKLLSRLSVYNATDISAIHSDMRELADIWYNFTLYLRSPPLSKARADKYRQLCERPRIPEELEKLRQKNSPSTHLPSPQIDTDERA